MPILAINSVNTKSYINTISLTKKQSESPESTFQLSSSNPTFGNKAKTKKVFRALKWLYRTLTNPPIFPE